MRELLGLSQPDRGEPGENVRLEDLVPLLHKATTDLRLACADGLKIANTLITRVNTGRWWKHTDPEPDIDRQLDVLRNAMEDFKQNRRLEVLDPFQNIIKSFKDKTPPPRALFYVFVFQANLVWVGEITIALLELLSETASKHPKARLWAPKRLRSLWKVLAAKSENTATSFGGGTPPDDPVEVERAQMVDSECDGSVPGVS